MLPIRGVHSSRILEEQVPLADIKATQEATSDVAEVYPSNLLGKPAHVGVTALPALKVSLARIQVVAFDHGEDLLYGGRVVRIRTYGLVVKSSEQHILTGKEHGDSVCPQLHHHVAALVVPIRRCCRSSDNEVSLPGVVHVEKCVIPPVHVHLL